MNCPRCKVENEPGVKFCKNCGANLSPALSTENNRDARDLYWIAIYFGFLTFIGVFYVVFGAVVKSWRHQDNDLTGEQKDIQRIVWSITNTLDFTLLLLLLVFMKHRVVKRMVIIYFFARIAVAVATYYKI